MVHIVFNLGDIEVLKKAFELDEKMSGEVVQICDDYAVGPLDGLMEAEGWQKRKEWWASLMAASPYGDQTGMVNDRMTLHNLKRKLEENKKEVLWIWMGQNGHDVCGYYWLISQLKEYSGQVFVLYLNNLPFINEKGGIFYPSWLHEIQPREFLKAKKLNRAVTPGEFEVDGDEWIRLCTENAFVRMLEGGKKLVSKGADFYDEDIRKNLSGDWQKGSRAMSNILGKMKIKTGDVFLLWRMRQLAEAGELELNGDPSKGWKEFEVRLKSAAPEPATTAT